MTIYRELITPKSKVMAPDIAELITVFPSVIPFEIAEIVLAAAVTVVVVSSRGIYAGMSSLIS